ncbi:MULTISPECIES: alginate biosynthesis protein Alg44 [unclassified Pseudomonas]|uniref:alginate biosynthesis protein Alg44 n=1 Tax=unclassified Pseudomonas TaxID=196821 RepID=UPI000BC7191C|nr:MULTISPECIES: alginate biosynthesis protein Alg44 [unclassified Pseudomonas]PVZ12394.1 alginate biosynthesis protein Alg44 [Pseudomonas sp. URIL14HWK12:I12]PVZ23454.1 alginate biosynthesis protein Alg44 [Pseudomonas sp. URIL14HWK12:I10]PVZ32784.1 alginate biosynthesis protein Alg44 [Pseudomonas sp. URIL14HWK12:I11]SNZ14078.1 alginate biosynthesis protein Alg44 [Pseudomonas sp. URIL14HWK12:I9]
MSTAINTNVVHESEAQRQFARVRLPAKIRFIGPNRETQEARVDDLSAGGFSFVSPKPLVEGQIYRGRLMFVVDNLGLGMDVQFQARSADNDGRVGAQFQNLSPADISTLRHLITSHMSGELVTMGDVLGTLQRENFTKARKDKKLADGRGFLGRASAVGFSLGVFIVGVAAFGYVLKSIYGAYFVTHAEAAVVSVPGTNITMPRDGTVSSLISPDGVVAKGAPLASFSTSMLDVLKGHLEEADLTPEKVTELFGKQMTGTLTSPCDCVVAQQLVANGQYASKGDVIFTLAPRDATAGIDARFAYSDFQHVRPGSRVTFHVAGEDTDREGTIVSSTPLKQDELSSDIRVSIKPDEALPSSLAGRPVEVANDRGPSLDWLINKAVARGF